MKTGLLISLFTLAFCATFAQSTVTKTNTAGCGMPYIVAMKNGGSFEQTSYDSKGNVTGVFKSIVESNVNGEVMMRQEGHDAKNREWEPTTISFQCTGNELIMDPKAMMKIGDLKPKDKAGRNEMTIKTEVSGDRLIIKKNTKVGDSQPDANIVAKIMMTGIISTTTVSNMRIKNRMVTAQEKISLPIGEFDCDVLEHDVETETEMMGMKMKNTGHVKMWFSPERGIVKIEMTNEKMKRLNFTQVMTAWNF